MAQIGFGVPSKGTLADALQAIPENFRSFFRTGFAQLAVTDPKGWGQIAQVAETNGLTPSNVVIDTLGRPTDDAHPLVISVRLLLGLLAFRSETASEFVDTASKAGILEEVHKAAVLQFAQQFARDRDFLRQKLSQSELQQELLPLLTLFDISIDLRLLFEGTKVAAASPVAVVHIDTDSTDKELWLQMTPAQVEALIGKLSKTAERLKQAELLAPKLLR